MVGRRIGRFEVQSPLGKGGMGSVWMARDTLLGRAVAIKILSPELTEDEESRRRFRREGEIAAQLDHPGICAVYEGGEQDGMVWLAMACIDGETLADRIRERLMPVAEVLRVGRMIADALAYAHDRNVLHRDVTSRNIMIARDRRIVLLDFGLAIVSEATRITGPGAVVGTIAYMAPELLCGQDASEQSDVYGLGVVLYEALTGAQPFASQNAEALRYKVIEGRAQPIGALRADVGSGFEALVAKAMAREKEARYSSAAALLEALQACEEAESSSVAPRGGGPHAEPGQKSSHAAGVSSSADTRIVPLPPGPAAAPPDPASRLTQGTAPIYLAVSSIETDEDDALLRVFLDRLTEHARAALAGLERVRVVHWPEPGTPQATLRDLARAAGASLVLLSHARSSGASVRIDFSLVDPETGVRLSGGVADGSTADPFRMEDRFVEAISRQLGAAGPPAPIDRGAHHRDPAAQDRLTQALAYMRRIDHEPSLDGAISVLERLLATERASAQVFSALARAFLAKYQITRAREWQNRAASYCERALDSDPKDPGTMLAVAELHLAAGRAQDALGELEAIPDGHPARHEALLVRARALDSLGKADASIEACRAAIASEPNDWRAHHIHALAMFRIGHYEEAADRWREVTQLCPDNASAYRNLGAAYFHLDRYEEAIACLRTAARIRPHSMTYYNLGTVLYFLERYEESIEEFERAVAFNPADAVAWGNLGNACRLVKSREARRREAHERAAALIAERIAANMATPEDRARFAGWLMDLDRPDEARCVVNDVMNDAPDDVHCMVMAAHTYLRLGERDRSLGLIRQAVEHGYGIDAIRKSPELRDLKGDPAFEGILTQGAARKRAASTTIHSSGRPQ